jgi:hypothetical protein
MKTLLLIATIIVSGLFTSCHFDVKTGANSTTGTASSNSKIRNGVQLQENGLHAEQAFLLKQDGSLINDDNKVQVGEQVLLRLIISGWKQENNLVFPEASEKIATNTGVVFLDEPALLGSSIPDGTTLENAKYLTLYATITKLDKLYDYFVVSFKVWDKKSNNSLTGSYKLYI